MPGEEPESAGARVSDERLMVLYADGDAGAFEELLERYEGRAHAFFLRRTGSPERARDLYQELFLRIHRARDRFDPTRAFAPWFFQIAHRLWLDDHRRAHRTWEVPLGEAEPRSPEEGSEAVVADREELARLLERLSPEERHVLVRAKLAGFGYADLANELGKSVDAVKKTASRALQRLHALGRPTSHPIRVDAP